MTVLFAGEDLLPGLYRITEANEPGRELVARWDGNVGPYGPNDRAAKVGAPSRHPIIESKVADGLTTFISIDDLGAAFDTGAVYDVSWDDTTVRGRYVDTTLKHSIEPESGSASADVGSTWVQWSFRQLDADDATFTVDSHQLLEAERVTA